MGRFHDRMDDDLRIRGYSANTRASYLRCVRHVVRHVMRPPDQLTPEHIRRYQLYLTRDRRVSWTRHTAGVEDRLQVLVQIARREAADLIENALREERLTEGLAGVGIALCRRLLGRLVSEYGRLCHRKRARGRGNRCGRGLVLATLLATAGLAARHPELDADEPATAAVQDRRAAHPPCPILHLAAGGEPLDAGSLSADSRAHRATRVVPDLSRRLTQGAGGMSSERGTRRRCLLNDTVGVTRLGGIGPHRPQGLPG